ncbi:hypothetical protein Hanom_Chr12g01124481 [Helianthus anomalus]
MHTLREEVNVFSDVVDDWVDVLNYEELDRTAGCLTRIYFRTTVIVSIPTILFDLCLVFEFIKSFGTL